jgi:mannose-6-phosphate isomerase-like protein (cupin superfamily)
MSEPLHTTLQDMLASLPGPGGERYATAFTRGTLRALMYAPRGTDPQEPHQQDEVYVVMKGVGSFVVGDSHVRFREGDVLFAAASVAHRFEDFTDDLVLWVFFYGPPGGENQAAG